MNRYETKTLDKLWTLACLKKQDSCIVCSREDTLNVHHIVSRSNRATRWDIDNGAVLCAGHHALGQVSAHKNPLWFMDLLIEQRGEKAIRDLKIRSQMVSYNDFKLLKLYLTK